jgi:hypothetical protein
MDQGTGIRAKDSSLAHAEAARTTDQWKIDHNWQHNLDDRLNDVRENRISALEEVIAARWPRSALVKRRLRRRLRQIDHNYSWAGPSFASRQAEAMTCEDSRCEQSGP